MKNLVKFPRTSHLPWSDGCTSDDKIIPNLDDLLNQNVVITEKLDGENCLDFSTRLQTPNGEILLGDLCSSVYDDIKVLGYNFETDKIEYCDVLGKKIGKRCDDWYEIELDNGDKLIVTGDHRIFLPTFGCYRKVIDLQVGDELLEN